MKNKSNKILKQTSVCDLDSKKVEEIVNKMNVINNVNISGLMKYEIIEVSGKFLYRLMRDYKVNLDEIDPVKYFQEYDPFEILNGILNVLEVLHKNGTFHSDLKPSNIFLDEDNELVISDYLNNLLFKGSEGKKPIRKSEDLCFVCIDELLGKELDISSDIWNFGLIFYYIKSGKRPFVGSNLSETVLNILNVRYALLDCEYSIVLNSFLRKVFKKEKKDRLKLKDAITELKKLNDPELPVDPIEEIKSDEEIKEKIDSVIKTCLKEDKCGMTFHNLNMGDEGIKYLCSALYTMNNVVVVDISNENVTSIGLNRLSESLKLFPNLEVLDISKNPIGNDNLKLLTENLHFVPKLKGLYLRKCELGVNDMKYLSDHFKDIPDLERLYISENRIEDEGIKYFSLRLDGVSKVKEIYLKNNGITSIGLNSFSECMKFLPELEQLDLSENPIGVDYTSSSSNGGVVSYLVGWLGTKPTNDGLKIFTENLHFIPKLKKLDLHECKLGDSDIDNINNHIKDIPYLQCLNISKNNISKSKSILKHDKLEMLITGDNEILFYKNEGVALPDEMNNDEMFD